MSPHERFIELVKAILPEYALDVDALQCLDCAMEVPIISLPESGKMLDTASGFVYAYASESYENVPDLMGSHIRRWLLS